MFSLLSARELGRVAWAGRVAVLTSLNHGTGRRRACAEVDLNDDGTLSAQEVLFTSLVSDEALRTGPFSPPALADRILRDLDVDMDGRLRDTEVAAVGAHAALSISC